MSHSLGAKLSRLRHKGYITDIEYQRLKKALEQEPSVSENPNNCDLISRGEVLENAFKIYTHECGLLEVVGVDTIKDLPSVKPQEPKWDRLYNWLNDMRLGIVPDETVDDIDERHCRESQTDILDEIMEWMIKAESEDKE